MGLRDVVNAVPAKPIISIAVGLTVLAATWHGWTLYSVCSKRSALTHALHDWAQKVVDAGPAGMRLDKITGFTWDQVRIAQNTLTPGQAPNCPFGWHLSNTERAAMAKAGDLTLIGFAAGGKLVEIADFDATKAQFDVGEEPIDRDRAVFRAKGNALALVPR